MALLILGLAARWLAGTVPSQESSPAGFWYCKVVWKLWRLVVALRSGLLLAVPPVLFFMAQIGHVSPTRPFDLAWAAQRPLFSAQLKLGVTGIG